MNTHAPERVRATRGRHRKSRAGGPASAVTAGIAAGALAVATYAASTVSAPTEPAEATEAGVGQVDPALAAEAVSTLTAVTGTKAVDTFSKVRTLRSNQGAAALSLSTDLSSSGAEAVRDASRAIAKQKKKEAAERKAAREAEERAAAERAAEEAAAAEHAAEEAAAAERAAEEAAAAERAAEQAASRSSQRQAPAQPAPVSSGDARSIARSMLASFGWGDDQWGCLDSLWMRESGWNHTAMNPSSGAYGIPQSLPGSKMASAGADWQTNPATQIEWGLGYIAGRYGSPCGAWAHSESVGWY